MFSMAVTGYWLPQDALVDGGYRVVVDDSLPDDRALTILEPVDGGGVLTLTSALAARLAVTGGSQVEPEALRSALQAAKVSLNGADYLFYLPVDGHAAVSAEAAPEGTRQLSERDAELFAQFTQAAPADDVDEAFVELDHWLVYGTFADGRLACAASMYLWKESRLADLGVITLPEFRGRGLARRTVRALSAHALSEGCEPQYRCQLDNEPSIALARACGFTPFGTWDVMSR